MTELKQALKIIEEFIKDGRVCSAENPDGIYDSIDEKIKLCEKFDEIKLFINNN